MNRKQIAEVLQHVARNILRQLEVWRKWNAPGGQIDGDRVLTLVDAIGRAFNPAAIFADQKGAIHYTTRDDSKPFYDALFSLRVDGKDSLAAELKSKVEGVDSAMWALRRPAGDEEPSVYGGCLTDEALGLLPWNPLCGKMYECSQTLLGAAEAIIQLDPVPAVKTPHRAKKRAGKPHKPRPLTARQVEVIQAVADGRGNIAEAARRLGRNRKAVEESYKAGMKKLGKVVYHSKDKTRLLTRDRRGQEIISEGDDRRRQ